MQNLSVLQGVGDRDVDCRPFAHLVRDAVFADEIYDRLAETFPEPARFVAGLPKVDSNQAVRIPAKDIVGNRQFDEVWQDFFAYHTSRSFWLDILSVFGDSIRATHPSLESTFGKKLEHVTVARRGSGEKADVFLDCLFVVNTPVTKMSSVRPAHVDSENEIFAGLFYMRNDDDPTPGGDLALYHFKHRPQFAGHYADLKDVIEDKVVSYDANRFVAFVNSAASLHGVTPRPPTQSFRRYINLIATTERNVFSLPRMSLSRQTVLWWQRRKSKSRGVMAKPQTHY